MNLPDVSAEWVTVFDEDAAEGIVSLVDFAVHDGGTLGYANPMDPAEAEHWLISLQQRIRTGDAHVLLGRVGRAPVMMAVLSLNGMHNCRHRAEISKGIVHPAFRGRRLVEHGFRMLVDRAEALGIEQFVLDVREDSRAHALWKRFGFATYGVLDDYARFNGTRHRGHYMVQTVASLRARVGMVCPSDNEEGNNHG